jgi:trk system potassium uptake protein TrkH
VDHHPVHGRRGTNFALFWGALTDGPSRLLGDAEFRYYAGLLGAGTALGAGLLYGSV